MATLPSSPMMLRMFPRLSKFRCGLPLTWVLLREQTWLEETNKTSFLLWRTLNALQELVLTHRAGHLNFSLWKADSLSAFLFNILKEYIINSKKTSIIKDINDLLKKEYNDEKEKTIMQFSLSQKKIIYHHFKLFRNQIIKEFKNDIFGSLKSNYV